MGKQPFFYWQFLQASCCLLLCLISLKAWYRPLLYLIRLRSCRQRQNWHREVGKIYRLNRCLLCLPDRHNPLIQVTVRLQKSGSSPRLFRHRSSDTIQSARNISPRSHDGSNAMVILGMTRGIYSSRIELFIELRFLSLPSVAANDCFIWNKVITTIDYEEYYTEIMWATEVLRDHCTICEWVVLTEGSATEMRYVQRRFSVFYAVHRLELRILSDETR